MAGSTKDSGTEILGTEKASRDILMETLILDNSDTEKLMAKEFIPGKMERYTMVSGIRDSNKVMEYGRELKMTLILENGLLRKHMDMEFTPGRMVIGMRGNGICA